MAETFKLGNTKWAVKEGSLLAYNDENNNFKPLPFTFTRSTTATRVNESGLIELVKTDVPKVDYLNNPDGHLLLEPSRTNLIQYSEDFSSFIRANMNPPELNAAIAPDGTNTANKIVATAVGDVQRFMVCARSDFFIAGRGGAVPVVAAVDGGLVAGPHDDV